MPPSNHGSAVRGDRTRAAVVMFLLLSSSFAAVQPVAAETAPTTSTHADAWSALVDEAAARFALPARWLRAVMHVESAGQVRAISPAGALGLMQVMPSTYAELQRRYGLGADPLQPHDNIIAGAAYLRDMLDRYGSPGFLAAYNAGPGRFEAFRDAWEPLPAETLRYVARLQALLFGQPDNAEASPRSPPQPTLFVNLEGGFTPPSNASAEPSPTHPRPQSTGIADSLFPLHGPPAPPVADRPQP